MKRSRISVLSRLSVIIPVLGFLQAPLVDARVTLKNGNFFRAYTDIGYKMGAEPKIERVYNSKTSYKGIFGPGWGNEYEVKLSVSPDGSVVVHEYGGGAENRFTPAKISTQEVDEAVKKIAELKKIPNPKANEEYREKLRTDAFYRNEEWQSLVNAGKLQAKVIPVGARLTSNRFAYQSLTKLKDGYQRSFDTGKVEKFDEKGRLVRVSDKNGNYIELTYSKEGRIEKLVDNMNRKMFFTFNNRGLLEKVQGEDGVEAVYKYNPMGELVESKDAEGNVYKYKYTTDNYHNLIEVTYSDGTTIQVAYYGVDKYMGVKSLKERDGTVNEYDYVIDPKDRGHLTVTSNVKDSDGKIASRQKYEYFFKYKPDGEEWTYKLVQTTDGDTTETVYNECCGLPLLIKRGGEETSFVYDTKGRVVKKSTPSEITELSYDAKAGKVSKVVKNSKINKKFSSWSQFEYDERGNLKLAKNSDKKGVRLFYDATGRIKTLVDQDRRQLDFKYDQNSRPVEITDPKLGTIKVTYNATGIEKVDSAAGQKVALQVTTAFQNLLEIIRPAGVNLTP
jgi:YD repeat-containing protein